MDKIGSKPDKNGKRGKLGIDDSKVSIPNIDESQMVYGKKATDSSEIKTTDDSITHTNDSVLFDFSDRSSEPSTNDLKMCDSSVECLRPNHSDHDSYDSISGVSAPASESRDTIVIDCARQEDFPNVSTSSIETDNISSSDLLCWNIILKGNSAKSMTTDNDGNLNIRPPVTVEEHQQVQREKKARTILLSSLPDEHMGDFYHMIDARDIWNAINVRFGGNAESKKMQNLS
nr:xylulose kinase-1 [Tanacetum cinerariifolium]